jgi:hypothetical protein
MNPMRYLIAATATVAVLGGIAVAQPYGPGPGARGPGMGMGRGMMAFGDVDAYTASLKAQLGIVAPQEAAWNDYAVALKAAAGEIQGVHQTMWDAMGTATWQERQAMMNRAFEQRQSAFGTVHAAALKLEPSLTSAQRSQAAWMLPGLRTTGPGMGTGRGMGRNWP